MRSASAARRVLRVEADVFVGVTALLATFVLAMGGCAESEEAAAARAITVDYEDTTFAELAEIVEAYPPNVLGHWVKSNGLRMESHSRNGWSEVLFLRRSDDFPLASVRLSPDGTALWSLRTTEYGSAWISATKDSIFSLAAMAPNGYGCGAKIVFGMHEVKVGEWKWEPAPDGGSATYRGAEEVPASGHPTIEPRFSETTLTELGKIVRDETPEEVRRWAARDGLIVEESFREDGRRLETAFFGEHPDVALGRVTFNRDGGILWTMRVTEYGGVDVVVRDDEVLSIITLGPDGRPHGPKVVLKQPSPYKESKWGEGCG